MSESRSRQRLARLGPERISPGLDRIRAVLERLENPHQGYPSAIIAGTNGKGSTAAMLAAIGTAAGLRVGVYSSPHLVDLEERFQIDGHPISRRGLESHLDAVLFEIDDLNSSGELSQQLSYFETLTAVAFRFFHEARVDLAILEVGLGGRLDATNVTTPRVSIITPISVDHSEWLGSTLAEIAAEKIAVVPHGGVAVVAPQPPEVREVIESYAADHAVTLLDAEAYPLMLRSEDARQRVVFDLQGRLRSYAGLELALAGHHQLDNARCAILASEALDRRRMRISSDAVWAGLRNVTLPGRCEWIEGDVDALLDCAHNPGAAATLARYLRGLRSDGSPRIHLLMGVLRDKDMAGIAAELFPLADSVVTTSVPSSRSAEPEALLAAAQPPPIHAAVRDPTEALQLARSHAAPGDLLCVTGSLYLVGALRPQLLAAD